MHGESNMKTSITVCKIDNQWEFVVLLRELKLGLCDNLEGWDTEVDGREFKKGGDICIPQRRQWHPTPVLLLEKSHGRRSLVGCSPWSR